jgi:alpha-glucosidase
MKRLLLVALVAGVAALAGPIDFNSLVAIGPAAGEQKTADAVTITCADRSQIRIEPLAADLILVRAAFGKPLPASDHSWVVVKTSWPRPRWRVSKSPAAFVIATNRLEVVVQRSPLLISFLDAHTHRVINAESEPMRYDPKSGAIAAFRHMGFDEHFYGLGEKAARLDRRRGRFEMWNTDAYHYKLGTDPLYQSIPFYIGLQGGAAYGLFFDNSYRTYFDFGSSTEDTTSFAAAGGPMDYYFFAGPSMRRILGLYADLTGHMPMWPMWALGHQQSRYSYYPKSRVLEIAETYRKHDLPLDVIHLDIAFMNGYRLFTWNTTRFPGPTGMIEKLRQEGIKIVTILDPGIKYQPETSPSTFTGPPELGPQDTSYYVYNQGKAGDYFLKRKDGSTYIGKVWPGKAVFVDYTIEKAAQWWGNLLRAYTDHGVAGIWCDMNEPSDFLDQKGVTQGDVLTYDGGRWTPYAGTRNVFALNMTRATYEGLARLRPNRRPYVITRAGFAGIQRYSTMWTGDNTASWDSMALSIPMMESLGMSGEPFIGADVGGFAGNSNAQLLTRWYELAFLAPFFRNHAEMGSYDHEPWRFGTYYEDIIRKYLKLRYRMLPFLYTELEQAHRTGMPLFRPLVLNYQNDENTVNIDDEYMVGDELLAAPVLHPDEDKRLIYLPEGTWFDYWTGMRYQGGRMITADAPLQTIPLFVRGGAVLTLGPAMNWVGEKPEDPLTFEIYPDSNGNAAGTLYEDDGVSPAYENGVFRRTAVRVAKSGAGFEIGVGAPEGTWAPPARAFVFVLHGGAAGRVRELRLADDGKAHEMAIR